MSHGSTELQHDSNTAFLNRIGTAVPAFDVHDAFVAFAADMLHDERTRALFLRMAQRSGIRHRFSVLNPYASLSGCGPELDAAKLYTRGAFPDTAERMRLFEQTAPQLARLALDRLALSPKERASVSHVLVTSCTGLYAPGLDFEIVDHLGLQTTVERTVIGFMGCYAAMNALKLARHIVRSEPDSAVLILNLELCTLHLQETQSLEQILSFLVFADGAAASLVSSNPSGLALSSFRAVVVPETRQLITWNIGSLGFDMLLSGQVPAAIARTLRTSAHEITAAEPGPTNGSPHGIDLWAVHPGGRSVLDAVEHALHLPPQALAASRHVLDCFGNMSSATIMFVLEHILKTHPAPNQRGCAMSFGPGLTAETLLFQTA